MSVPSHFLLLSIGLLVNLTLKVDHNGLVPILNKTLIYGAEQFTVITTHQLCDYRL